MVGGRQGPGGCHLWLVRHAQPVVAAGVCYGTTDMPADLAATQAAAQRLSATLPAGALLCMSGLQRAQQLAQAVHALRPDLAPPRTDARLNEMNFGQWEGWPWSQIPQAAVDAWVTQFAHHRFGGQESVADLLARIAAALRDVPWHCGGDVVWVCHAGVIRAVEYLWAHPVGLPQAGDWPVQAPGFGDWRVFEGVYS